MNIDDMKHHTATRHLQRKNKKNVVCSIPRIKGSFMKKATNALMNYIRCLLITPICFGRLLRPSSGCTVLKMSSKKLCMANGSKI
jgi:hypothetical protein